MTPAALLSAKEMRRGAAFFSWNVCSSRMVLFTWQVITVPVPADCVDGFALAFWSRPEAVLDPGARAATSGFARMDKDREAAAVARPADPPRIRRLGSGARAPAQPARARRRPAPYRHRIVLSRQVGASTGWTNRDLCAVSQAGRLSELGGRARTATPAVNVVALESSDLLKLAV